MKKYDLTVIGGGFGGVSAAISAAREGLDVLIIEKNGSFGGAMSSSLVYPFCPYWTSDGQTATKIINAGIFSEMRERAYKKEFGDKKYELLDAPIDIRATDNRLRFFSPEFFKAALDDMVRDAGVDVIFHATACGVHREGRKIKSVTVATKSGTLDVEADFFIDGTGDGALLFLAGCEHLLGREEDNLTQPMTTCFRVCNVDTELYKKELPELQRLYKEQRASGKIKNPRENLLQFYGLGDGIVHYNTTRVVRLNPTDPIEISRAEIEARAQVIEVFGFLKENSAAYKNAVLVSVASEIGVRESRKLVGEHILTTDELFDSVKFEDRIALGNYDVDIHSPDGTGTCIKKYDPKKYYYIPYRSLLPKEYDNMLVVGRCISATHEAQSSVRIMPICASMGQAAGVAMANAHKNGKSTREININEVQDRLRALGAAID
jgi:glycine/D-amino acid oxidase-like deaminating enzyme